MNGYTQILVCIDFAGEENQILDRAVQLGANNGATRLSVVHVVKPLSYASAGDLPVDLSSIQDEIRRLAQGRMEQVARKYSLQPSQLHVLEGTPQREIHRLAQQLKADLIVIGTHGRHGFALLLGSTANAVLHGTPSDVLAVKIRDED
jgi:universal stress protein A